MQNTVRAAVESLRTVFFVRVREIFIAFRFGLTQPPKSRIWFRIPSHFVLPIIGGDWNPEGGGVLRAVGIPRMVGVVRNHRDCRIRQELFGKRIRAVGAVDAVGAIWRYRGRLELSGSVWSRRNRLESPEHLGWPGRFLSIMPGLFSRWAEDRLPLFFVPFCPFSPARGPESRKKFVPSLDLSGVRIQQ